MLYGTIRSQFPLIIYMSNKEEHFLIVTFEPSLANLKHNNHREEKETSALLKVY